MPQQPIIPFPFPLQGQNQNWPLTKQPPLSSPDLLNVIPFDTDAKRARGGQRPGVLNLLTTPIQNDRFQLLHPTVSADNQTEVIDTAFTETFSSGAGHANGDDLSAADGGTRWTVFTSTIKDDIDGTGASTAAGLRFDGTGVKANTTTVKYATAILANGSITGGFPTNGGVFQIVVSFSADSGGVDLTKFAYVLWGGGPHGFATHGGVYAYLTRTKCILGRCNGDGTVTELSHTLGATLATNTLYTLQLIITADTPTDYTATVKLDGAVVSGLNFSVVNGLVNVGTRMCFGHGGDVGATSRITSFAIYNSIVEVEVTITRKLVAVVGGDVYLGSYNPTTRKVTLTLTTAGTNALIRGRFLRGCDSQGNAYIVDGEGAPTKVDLGTATCSTLTATAGTIPLNCRLVCMWRDRLVLAGQDASQQNIYMSRSGTHTDFDYSPAVPDALQAVALNASERAGRIGDAVFAIIPYNDDTMIIGCDHSIFAMHGDPAAGGVIDVISTQVGIWGSSTWTVDPSGVLWFVGPGGLWHMKPGSKPENVSRDFMDLFFTTLSRKGTYTQLHWDRDRHGLWMFFTKIAAGGVSTSLFYSARTKGFFPVQIPDDHGPMASCIWDGDAEDDRVMMLGGRTGSIRAFFDDVFQDDGTAISSRAVIGPLIPAGAMNKAKLIEMEVVLGSGTTNLDYAVQTGQDPAAALAATADFTGNWTASGRQGKIRDRARGNTFVLKLSNATINKSWTMERITGTFMPAGRER